MSGRSPSGVASLRARFEQNKDTTPPPSRGRSPTDSVGSDTSRPLSKVRTSFIAVERSGHMADLLSVKEDGSNDKSLPVDGAAESKAAMNGHLAEKPSTNGNASLVQTSAADVPVHGKPEQAQIGSAKSVMPVLEKPSGSTVDTSAAKPDKPTSAAEDGSADLLPADSKDAAARSGGSALAEDTPGLGSILKGSPFEKDDEKKAPRSQKPAASVTRVQPSKAVSNQAKAPVTGAATAATANSKPKETQVSQAKPQPKPKAEVPAAVQTQAPPPKESVTGPIGKGPAKIDPSSSKPSMSVNTSKEPPKSALAPRTPINSSAPIKQSPSKTATPKQSLPSKEPKESTPHGKMSDQKSSRPSVAAKAPVAATSKPAHSKPTQKVGPTSPPGFTKPRPRSPTRPVKLPASATAPTTASAAKLDGAPPPSRSPSRTSNVSAAKKDRTSSHTKPIHLRQSTARTSLPPRSRPLEQPKSKPRMSVAGMKAPDDGFLERMMRPTASSASKTHEKVEVKPPPKKVSATRPRGKSNETTKNEREHVETKSLEHSKLVPESNASTVSQEQITGATGVRNNTEGAAPSSTST